jgi:hypothetical protein
MRHALTAWGQCSKGTSTAEGTPVMRHAGGRHVQLTGGCARGALQGCSPVGEDATQHRLAPGVMHLAHRQVLSVPVTACGRTQGGTCVCVWGGGGGSCTDGCAGGLTKIRLHNTGGCMWAHRS